MLAQVIDLFGIRVDAELATTEPNQTLAELTARLVDRVDKSLTELTPSSTRFISTRR